MTTLDQVRLLETKVESAVEKIQQLQAENDALRNKCAELTNALDSKTEQLLSFTTSKEEIEDGIKKALDRLNYIEHSVIGNEGNKASDGQASIQITPGVTKISEEQAAGIIAASPSAEPVENAYKTESPVEEQQVNQDAQNNVSEPVPEENPQYEAGDFQQSETEEKANINTESKLSSTISLEPEEDFQEIKDPEDITDNVTSGMYSQGIPNFDTMETVTKPQQAFVPENSEVQNDNNATESQNHDDMDEGDQDAFEYDIF